MNIINQQVHHHQFETGTVVNQTETTVTVKFSDKHGTKKFIYPSAFESFLELSSPAAKAKLDDELRQMRDLAEEIRRKRGEEEEIKHEQARRALLEQKRALAKKRPAAKKAPSKVKEQAEDESDEES